MQKSGLMRKLKIISELMWSSNGKQMITMYTLDNNWRSKGCHTMKFGQIIQDKVRKFFFKGHAESEAERQLKIPFFMR